MKTATYLLMTVTLMISALSVHAGVTIGEITFNTDSAETDATWYEPMQFDKAIVLEGYGANEGFTRTVSYSDGGLVAGVQTIKRHLVEKTTSEKTEDLWIAFDAQSDVRVLKVVRNGVAVFEASTTVAPPLYLPCLPTVGQSWVLAGTTITIEQVMPSNSGTRLKIKSATADGKSESNFIHVGEGLLLTESSEDSGWRLKPQGVAPQPSTAP